MSGRSADREDDRHEMMEEVAPAAIGGEAASRRLAQTYLMRGQLRTRALFAALFGITQVAAALLVASVLMDAVPLGLVGGWAALVTAANIWVHGRVKAESPIGTERDWRPVVEALLLAALWISLPAWSFAAQPLEPRVVLAGATVAVIVSAVGLAAMPAAALAYMGVLVAGFAAALLLAIATVSPMLVLTFAGIATVSILTVARISRWTYGQLKQDAASRAESESIRLLLQEYEHRGVGWLWQTDAENRILYLSTRMGSLLGRSAQSLIGQSLPGALGGGEGIGRALLDRAPFADLDMEVRTRQGSRWIRLAGDPILDRSGRFLGFRGVGHDITDVRKTQERLTHIANLDVLCGLPNRGRMRQLIEDALADCGPGARPCALLLLDLDAFKPVNDRFGHPKGDLVLKGVAQRLLAEVGSLGHVGRIGGDEFAIILCDAANRAVVETLAERVVRSLAEPFYLDKNEVRIGVSIGCAFGPVDGHSVDELVQKADLALYQAKAEGRGTCRYFNADLQNEAEDRMRLERDLRQGLKTGQFRLVYQPLVDSGTQRLTGFEALIRWHHPTRGVVPPGDFIPLAEESGLIVQMGEWVIREACRALAQWQDVTVAVNVSPRQLASPALPGTVRDALGKHRLAANRLELEVTESVFMEDSSGALEVLRRLRALGLGIALDDFGTGYSSLGYLNKAVFHKLKIDGSFVREAGGNKETVAIIQSIVALARSFRMVVTAEGVETADDFIRMRDLGCHQIQGYYFGRPMSFDEADALVRRETQLARA